MPEFKEYTSLLEVKFDYENALHKHLENLWFVFGEHSISMMNIKPVCIMIQINKKVITEDINQIYKTLGFIPVILSCKETISIANARAYVKKAVGIIYIHNKTFCTSFRKEAKEIDKYKHYDDILKEFLLSDESAETISSNDDYNYDIEMEKLNNMNLNYVIDKNGLINDDMNTLITKNIKICEKEYNTISKYRNVIYLNENDIFHSIGNFYIYHGKQTFPVQEHIAMVVKCERCGKYYIKNYFTQRKNVCFECK